MFRIEQAQDYNAFKLGSERNRHTALKNPRPAGDSCDRTKPAQSHKL